MNPAPPVTSIERGRWVVSLTASYTGRSSGVTSARGPPAAIAVGEDWLETVERPLDADLGIVPGQPAFVFGAEEIGALVLELGDLREHQEAVRKARFSEEAQTVFFAQLGAGPSAEGRAAAADVDDDVEDAAAGHPHQFGLGVAELVVEPAQHAAG